MIKLRRVLKIAGFTLAEVLITLGIIGVIASMVIPTLLNQSRDRATVAAVKETYSILSSSYKLAVLNDLTPDNWSLDGTTGAKNLLDKFVNYLKVVEYCGTTETTCFPNVNYKTVGGGSTASNLATDTTIAKARLNNGTAIGFKVLSSDCTNKRGASLALQSVCGVAYVDINGNKSPNSAGIDLFMFLVTKYGIIPHGTQADTKYPFADYCKKALTDSSADGSGCTAWVIYNGNLDYLHCSDLDWSTKTQCD